MSERELQLDDLLHQLREEGQVDSSGSFTLETQKALEKLKNFRFAQPKFYVLKLVQAACAGGAGKIEVRGNSSGVTVEYDGRIPTVTEMEGLLTYLLRDQHQEDERVMRHLAAGVHGALGVGARRISFECWDGQEGFVHTFQAGGWSSKQVKGSGAPRVLFTLTREVSDTLKGFWRTLAALDLKELAYGTRSALDGELAAVYDRCSYCPIPVTLNGKRLQPSQFGEPRFPGYDISADDKPAATRVPWLVRFRDANSYVENLAHKRHHLVQRHYPLEEATRVGGLAAPEHLSASLVEGPRAGRLRALLALEAQLRSQARISYIEDGVLISQRWLDLGVPGIVGVVSAQDLHKDLSGFELITDAKYEEHLGWLKQQANELVQSLLKNPARVPNLPLFHSRLRSAGVPLSDIAGSG